MKPYPAQLSQRDIVELAALIRTPANLTPKQAIAYSGRGRTAVFAFMRAHPAACVVDADGIRRVRKSWVDAWCTGRHALDAMERGFAA